MVSVSIILPCYNSSSYIDRCLKSISEQTFKDFELIAIDNASQDDTVEKLINFARVANFHVNVICNEINYGPSKSRNIGLDEAKGKYVCFVDSDDYIADTYLEKLYNTCVDSNADFVSCGSISVYSDGSKHTYYANELDLHGGLEAVRIAEKFLINLAMFGTMINRKIIKKNNLSFYGGCSEDVFFHFQVLYYCNHYVSISNKLYYYYQNPNSITNNAESMNYSYIESFCTMLHDVDIFLNKIKLDDNVADEELINISKFFLDLSILNLKKSDNTLKSEMFVKKMQESIYNNFGNNHIYIRAFLQLVLDLKEEKYRIITNYNNKKIILNTDKNIVFCGDAKTDIDILNHISVANKMLFINIYVNENSIDLSNCIMHMKENLQNSIYLFITPSYTKVSEVLRRNGFIINKDFFDGKQIVDMYDVL